MLFSEYLEFIQADNPGPNGHKAASAAEPTAVIGAPLSRVDGPLKTTGSARYASDYNFPGMVYAVPVGASIASGKILKVDTSVAEKMPGVLTILYHGNFDPVFRNASGGRNSEQRPPFEDETVYYWGQYVALAVAETFAQAQAAAAAVKISYAPDKFNVATDLSDPMPAIGAPGGPEYSATEATPKAAFAAAPIKIDDTYITPVETHNPMEMHATVAVWDGKKFTLYESSQGVVNHLNVMAQVLGVPKENVEVISRFIGSGFGGKLFPWPHSALAAAAARQPQPPRQAHSLTQDDVCQRRPSSANPATHAPWRNPRWQACLPPAGLSQPYLASTTTSARTAAKPRPSSTASANLQVTSALVRRNVGTPTPMRGPGAVPGLFALESAMDELAIKLQKGPRPAPHRASTPSSTKRRTSPSPPAIYKECLQVGSGKFGWSQTHPERRLHAEGRSHSRLGRRRRILGCRPRRLRGFRQSLQPTVPLASAPAPRTPAPAPTLSLPRSSVTKPASPSHASKSFLAAVLSPPGPPPGARPPPPPSFPPWPRPPTHAIKVVLATATSAKGSPFLGKQPADARHVLPAAFTSKVRRPTPACPFRKFSSSANLASANGEGKIRRPWLRHRRQELLQPLLRRTVRRGRVGPGHLPAPRQPRRQRHRWRTHHQRQNRTQPDGRSRRHGHRHGPVRDTPPTTLAMAIPSMTTSPTTLSPPPPTTPTSTSPSSTSPTP